MCMCSPLISQNIRLSELAPFQQWSNENLGWQVVEASTGRSLRLSG